MTPSDGALGIPTAAGGLPTDKKRIHMQWTLPADKVGDEFKPEGFDDADRTFKMTEVTPEQQDHAAKIGANNNSVLSRELMFASLWYVGEWRCRDNRDKLNTWWSAIGQKGRRLVEAAFLKMSSVEETDVENFLSSGKSGS